MEQQYTTCLTAPVKFLLRSIDEETGKQNAVSLIAFGEHPSDKTKTLIFASPAPWQFDEFEIDLPFAVFQQMMSNTTHMAINNISQEDTQIDPQTPLGQFIQSFKDRILANTPPVGPEVN